jgi:2-polyprenyl-6-methoxyphenol hydroxylase-like FAD-dependent oxidoreductase
MNMGKLQTNPAGQATELGVWDVVVCGGGPAGCSAAISAARHGARTLLVEKDGYLGGATVSQLVCVILSTNGIDFQGIWHEYARALQKRGGISDSLEGIGSGQIRGMVDPEAVKFAWDDLLAAAGVEMLHHAHGSGVVLESGAIAGVKVETKAGSGLLRARRVVDATGDGIVCHHAGVPWDQGEGGRKYAMACTKVVRLGNVRRPGNLGSPEHVRQIEEGFAAAMKSGRYTTPVITTGRVTLYARMWLWAMPRHRNELLLVTSRVLKVDPLDPFDLTRAEREGRDQAWQVADYYKRYVPGCEASYLVDTSAHIGLRSSRRIRGLATVTARDALDFRKYPDGIARSSWDIDVWPADSYTAPAVDRDSEAYKQRHARLAAGDWFDIRYGCLLPAGVDNLLVAGRCLSAEHLAQSSLRIQQTCMATGQAAGTAAALSLRAGVTPRELDPAVLVAQLERDRDVEPAFVSLTNIPRAGGDRGDAR